ncbi:penicillin-binding transpeptidase domain-containing protein [Phragmitibacter flavus]|nr:penicillin-binding transpeptidase domain-containing protein [Phragmitibacter flavus]
MQEVAVTLGHSLWQGTVVAVGLAVVLKMMRSAGAGMRYGVCCLALVGLVLWPVWTWWQMGRGTGLEVVEMPWDQVMGSGDMTAMTQVGGNGSEEVDMVASGGAKVEKGRRLPIWGWLMVGWLSGMMLLTVWRTMGWCALRRLKVGAVPLSGEFETLARRLARKMRVGRRVVVYWSDKVGGPLVFGWWRPVVLLPVSLMTGFTAAQVEMILAHEFAHVRRQDYLVNLLQMVTETVLFFHPAVWWINRQIRREREHACDEAVVAVMGDADGYARTLTQLAERELDGVPSMALAMAASGERGDLWVRVTRLVRMTEGREELRLFPGLAWVGVLLVGVGVWLMPAGGEVLAVEVERELVRGAIRDRNGVALAVSDKVDRQVVFDLSKVMEAFAAKHDGILPMHDLKEKGADGEFAVVGEEPDIKAMFDEVVIAALNNRGIAKEYNANAMRMHFREMAAGDPWMYRSGLTMEEVKALTEMAVELPGIATRVVKLRRYPFGELASHVTGYVSQPDDQRGGNELFGVAGVEKSMDEVLKTVIHGKRRRGEDVFLTLDMRVQLVIERALREFDSIPKLDRGAAVLMDVETGDVLGMVSWPSYDPNWFVPSISRDDFRKLVNDWRNPMFNRAVNTFGPGGAYLPVTCLAGIAGGQKDTVFNCTGSVTFGSKSMKCWIATKGETHGPLGMREGMGRSCNTYFYQMGNAAGIDNIVSIGKALGLGQKSGIELEEEDQGILPSPDWLAKNRPKEKWSAGYTANTAIGAGQVLASPLQMTTVYAAIANGGTVWKPRLVDRLGNKKRPALRAGFLAEYGVTAEGMKEMRLGMEDVVQKYSAQQAKSEKISIAGRTGTAQNWRPDGRKDNHVWFCGYAPAEKPKWALTVFVQGAHSGGSVAAPIAKRIFEDVAAIESGELEVDLDLERK